MRQYAIREIREALNTWRDVTEESPTLTAVVGGCHGDGGIMKQAKLDGRAGFEQSLPREG